MSKIKLIDYIDSTDGKFLFLHPQSLGSYNIISFLVSLQQLEGKSVIIVTDDKDKINRCLPGPLPDENYVKYNDVGNINFESEYLLVDDYESYVSNGMDKLTLTPKIIVLTKGNVTVEGDWNILYLLLCEDGAILKHKLTVINKKDLIKTIANSVLLDISKKHLISGNKNDYPMLSNFTHILFTDDVSSGKDISNIQVVHIDKIVLESYLKIILYFYKRQLLSDNIDTFDIIFYVDPDNNTEIENYNKIIKYIQEYETNYINLFTKSLKIKYNDDIGVYVEI